MIVILTGFAVVVTAAFVQAAAVIDGVHPRALRIVAMIGGDEPARHGDAAHKQRHGNDCQNDTHVLSPARKFIMQTIGDKSYFCNSGVYLMSLHHKPVRVAS